MEGKHGGSTLFMLSVEEFLFIQQRRSIIARGSGLKHRGKDYYTEFRNSDDDSEKIQILEKIRQEILCDE